MRKYLLFAFLVVAIASIGCKKSSDGNPSNPSATGFMRGTVDGTVKNCDLALQASNQSNVLTLAGRWGGAGGGFTIAIPGFNNQTGTFNVGGGSMVMATYSEGTDQNTQYAANGVAGTGSIVITAYSSTNVKGTFQFTGRNNQGATKSVTNGEFSLNF